MSYEQGTMVIDSPSTNWFATQVDRCFHTNRYGDGIRLYTSDNLFVTIEGISYDEASNMLTVKAIDFDNIFIVKNEPDNELFKTTLLEEWKSWDIEHGASMGEDRIDYKPYAYSSLKALATDLKLYQPRDDENIVRYVT